MLTKARSISILSGIFLAGMATGVFLAPFFHHRGPSQPAPPRPFIERTMDRLQQKLDLTPEQKVRIEALMRDSGVVLGKIRRDSWQESMKEINLLNEKIAALLTPAQRVQFTTFQQEQLERLRHRQMEREGRYGFRGDGPPTPPEGLPPLPPEGAAQPPPPPPPPEQ